MPNILVVDDESNIRMMIRLALQQGGHQVAAAADGAEGLVQFDDGSKWDLVLLDQRMPGLEGLDVLKEMRRRAPAARVVIITAFGTIDLATEAMRSGSRGLLRKPFSLDVLRRTVDAALKEPADLAETQSAAAVSRFGHSSINGYRISSVPKPIVSRAMGAGSVSHQFNVSGAQGTSINCDVNLPAYLLELVKAHVDRDDIPSDDQFWLWFCEEALANYLWQNAEPPPGGTLQVDELSGSLKRWSHAMLSS